MTIKTKSLAELTGDDTVIWVCGLKFPHESDPRFADAMWGECETCRTKVVHSKQAPETATKLCRPCAELMYQAMSEGGGEEMEVVMTPEAVTQIQQAFGDEAAEAMMEVAKRRLQGGKP